MPDENLTIGDLVARSGAKVQTVRWYEQMGILPEAAETDGRGEVEDCKA